MPGFGFGFKVSPNTLSKGVRASVNDARYADYIAFVDARNGLIAVPDGGGGKRASTLSEWWATPGNVSFDSATYGVQDLVLSAQTTVATAIQSLMAGTECTVVFESYGRAINDRMIKPNAGGDLFLLVGADNARMVASSVVLQCSRRRGSITSRFRGICAWSAAGRTLALNGGNAAEDTTQPGTRSSPNFAAGRYTFIGIVNSRKSAAWIKGHSFPEPTAVIHGDSFAQGDAANTGQWWAVLSTLLPGSPPMEILGIGGTTGAQIETAYLAEDSALTCRRIVWGGHNSYDAATWKVQVANMVAATTGGLANFCLLPTFPSAADGAETLASKAALHAYFKALYGPHYLGNVLDDLVALGAPGQPYADPVSYAKGVPPVGLRYDAIHLSKACTEGLVAPMIRAAYPSLGWRV